MSNAIMETFKFKIQAVNVLILLYLEVGIKKL